METNDAKKPKRPRIGQVQGVENQAPNQEGAHYESTYNAPRQADGEQPQGGYQPRQQGGYQPRQQGYQPRGNYGNRPGGYHQGGYQQRNQGGWQPRNNYQGGYQQRPYQQRPAVNPNEEGTPTTTPVAEGATDAASQPQQQGGYQPRNNYNQQGGYQQRPYNNRQQGGYQQRPYNNNRQQGGYQPRNNQGGYQQRPYGNQQGGYQPRNNYNQQGGYQQRPYGNQQGGYQQRPYGNQQGGYQQHRPGQGPKGGRFQKGPVRQGKSFTPRPKRIEYELPLPDPDEKIRLNKFMANAGICSRREADEFIQQGLVKVNGEVVTELGTKISHSDTVEYDDKVVALESKCYILLNKPKDCVTTSDDPNGRTTVLDLVKGACNERIYPVGRLDRNTTGVLLLTNDGDLASKLTHPKYVKKKIYHVWTDKDISEEDMQRIADGIELDDGPIHADAISYATETDRNQAGIEIHSGRNRIVRRIFESLGYHVTKLDRVYFAGLTKKNLPRGRWRYLTQEEVNFLKMNSFE